MIPFWILLSKTNKSSVVSPFDIILEASDFGPDTDKPVALAPPLPWQ
jgi:hypothetical protein